MGHKIVSLDNDIPSISRLYDKAKNKGLKILTLYNDFKSPPPAHGLKDAYPSFEERFCFDIVLSMAVVHHLTYFSKMTFDEIAGRLSKFSKKYSLVEFIPREDFQVLASGIRQGWSGTQGRISSSHFSSTLKIIRPLTYHLTQERLLFFQNNENIE